MITGSEVVDAIVTPIHESASRLPDAVSTGLPVTLSVSPTEARCRVCTTLMACWHLWQEILHCAWIVGHFTRNATAAARHCSQPDIFQIALRSAQRQLIISPFLKYRNKATGQS